jgi:hypothetical protein
VTYPAQPQFSQPSQGGQGGDQFDAKDHRGHLLLVYPKTYQPEVPTKNGPSSAADVDIVIIDKQGPDGKPLAFINARLFGNLANSVRNDIGGQVLGRLDQIQTQGGRTPWVLQSFTDQDAAAAGPVHAAYQQGLFKPTPNPMASPQGTPAGYAQTPQTPASPPAQQQWQQQATPAPQAAPAYAQQAPPTTQPQQQWQQPAAPQAGPPAPTAPQAPAASGVDPQLAGYLQSRGIDPSQMNQQQAEAVAAALPQ